MASEKPFPGVNGLERENPSEVLVTGATGFVGSALVRGLLLRGHSVRVAIRRHAPHLPLAAKRFGIGAMEDCDWSESLSGAQVVVHAAARVHVMRETATNPLEAFRRVNVASTLSLARAAAALGVKRFVFLSSIKALGESTTQGQPFAPRDTPAPLDPYGISKLEAEEGLRAIAAETSLELTVVRLPLVYGPGVRGNFRTMMSWLRRGVPLPLGRVRNQRSLVGLDNLVDFLCLCAAHSRAAGQTFHVSDGQDLSTTELLRGLGFALGHPARLVPIPEAWLFALLHTMGKDSLATRLFGSLQVDGSSTQSILGWRPPSDVTAELRRTAESFLRETRI
jgi:nucleoside-diphosphate-sugar epimerase